MHLFAIERMKKQLLYNPKDEKLKKLINKQGPNKKYFNNNN